MSRKTIDEFTRYFGLFRLHKKHYPLLVTIINLFILFQYHSNRFLPINKQDLQVNQTLETSSHSSTSILYQYSLKTSNQSQHYSHLTRCPRQDIPADISVHKEQLVNMITLVLQSRSLMYCPVPKVATKTLLTIMLYMHVRDISEHLEHNWTNIDVATARIEQGINISTFIKDLQQNGIKISKEEEPKSLAAFLRMYLDVLRFSSMNTTLSSRPINPWRHHFTFAFPYLRLNSLSNLSQIFSPPFVRAIFVRHPFERLASAYKERIATLHRDRIEPEPEYDAMREVICRHHLPRRNVHQSLPEKDPCMETIPSFEQFVRYILLRTDTPVAIAKMDYHWQPYSALCQVCKFKYNFIGKYETFNDHFNHFLGRFNLSDWNIQKRNGASGLTKWDYQKFYSTLPDELICQLIRVYEEDFRLFEYQIDDYINRPTLMQTCN